MFQIAVVDDDTIFREIITKVINSALIYMDIEYQIYTFSTTHDCFYHDVVFDLAFLDIEIGSKNGIELAKMIHEKNTECYFIFVTSFDHYMKKAFGKNVIAYITKDEYASRLPDILRITINTIMKKSVFNLKSKDGIMSYKMIDIYSFYIENRRIYMQTDEKVQIYYTSLKKLINELNGDFVFIGSNYIVNMHNIKMIKSGSVILENDTCVFIPKGKVKEFNDNYKNFLKRKVKT